MGFARLFLAAVLLAVILWGFASLVSPSPQNGSSSVSSTVPGQSSSATTTPLRGDGVWVCNGSVVWAAVERINELREEFGVPPVHYMNTTVALYKVRDMVERDYFGHCDPDGVPYFLGYTLHGGVYDAEENLGVFYSMEGELRGTPLNYTLRLIDGMVYNDSESNWGHRDSLLDPTNNYVDVACAYNGKRFYLAIYMLKVWVDWIDPPAYNDTSGLFHAAGRITLVNSSLEYVGVYVWKAPHVISWPRRAGLTFTCHSISISDFYAYVLPYRVEGARVIEPETYVVDDGFFNVTFHVPRFNDSYTIIVLWADNTLPVKHPFDKERYDKMVTVLTYTIPPARGSRGAS